jgi:hypothetical protein
LLFAESSRPNRGTKILASRYQVSPLPKVRQHGDVQAAAAALREVRYWRRGERVRKSSGPLRPAYGLFRHDVPRVVPREAPLKTLWWRITQTTCSAPSKRRKKRSTGPDRTAIRHLSRACGISTTRKYPTIRAPPDRRQHSLVNRVACNQTLFAVGNPDLAEPV